MEKMGQLRNRYKRIVTALLGRMRVNKDLTMRCRQRAVFRKAIRVTGNMPESMLKSAYDRCDVLKRWRQREESGVEMDN